LADVKRLKQLQGIQQSQQKLWQNVDMQKGSSTVDPIMDRAYQGLRSPMMVTTRAWLRKNKFVVLWVNPSDVAWNLPRRETVSKTAAGAIRNTWRNRFRGTYYDEPTLSFTFQTGNIMPYANIKSELFGKRSIVQNNYIDPERGERDTRFNNTREPPTASQELLSIIQEPPVPPGLQNLYDFMGLIDQPILQGWGENRHILFYRTPAFPRLRLEGYFSPAGLSFTESANNANSLTWTAQFQVYRTEPAFWKPEQLKMAYSVSLRENGFAAEMFPPGYNLTFDQISAAAANAAKLPKNPKDPKESKLTPDAKTKVGALVNKDGKTAVDASKDTLSQLEQSALNYAKTLDSFIKKYDLKEPAKSKFIAEMNKFENQAAADSSYVPQSTAIKQAQLVLASVQFSNPS